MLRKKSHFISPFSLLIDSVCRMPILFYKIKRAYEQNGKVSMKKCFDNCFKALQSSLLFALQSVMSRLVLLVVIFATLEVRVFPIMSNEVTRDVLIGQKISSQLIRICPLMRHLWDELTFWEEFIICILLLRTQTLWNTHDRHPVFLNVDTMIENSILVVSES